MDPGLWGVMVNLPEELEKTLNAPTRKYVGDTQAMASTPADVKEYPSKYEFVIDMPGLKAQQIKVQIEDENVLVITGDRHRADDMPNGNEKEKEKEQNVKYLRMERRIGKFMRKFNLPDNCDKDAISAACSEGVLTVTVPKLPPPEPKKPKTIQACLSHQRGVICINQLRKLCPGKALVLANLPSSILHWIFQERVC